MRFAGGNREHGCGVGHPRRRNLRRDFLVAHVAEESARLIRKAIRLADDHNGNPVNAESAVGLLTCGLFSCKRRAKRRRPR
jgi:hypothetical protein